MKRPKCSLLAQRNVALLRLDLQVADFRKRHAGTVRIPRTEHEARAVSRLGRSTTAVLAARLHHRSGGQDWLLGHCFVPTLLGCWKLNAVILTRDLGPAASARTSPTLHHGLGLELTLLRILFTNPTIALRIVARLFPSAHFAFPMRYVKRGTS